MKTLNFRNTPVRKNIILLLPLFVIAWLFFLALSFRGLDPDLGWHLRVGVDFLRDGVFPKYDAFSFAIPRFPWIDYEFGTELILAKIYQLGGYISLGLFLSGVTALLFSGHLLLTRHFFKVRFLTIAVCEILVLFGFISVYGLRVPVISLWMNIILFWLVYLYLQGLSSTAQKTLWAIGAVIFFLIWANLHPSFSLGIGILWGAIIYKSLRDKKVEVLGILVAMSATTITLINPYGIFVWREILGYILPSGALNKNNILEWRSIFLLFPISLWTWLPFEGLVVVTASDWKEKVRDNFYPFMVTLGYLVMTILAVRNLGLFTIWAAPFCLISVNNLFQKILIPKYISLIRILVMTLVVFGGFTGAIAIKNLSVNFLKNGAPGYPSDQALAKVKQLTQNGERVYDPYDWGGYLDWHFDGSPQVFIDGRMPATWFNSSDFPFKDYVAMYNTKGKVVMFKKYNFTIAIVKPTQATKLDAFNRLLIGGDKEEERMNLEAERLSVKTWLEKQTDWEQVFKDETAVVFVKKTIT